MGSGLLGGSNRPKTHLESEERKNFFSNQKIFSFLPLFICKRSANREMIILFLRFVKYFYVEINEE